MTGATLGYFWTILGMIGAVAFFAGGIAFMIRKADPHRGRPDPTE